MQFGGGGGTYTRWIAQAHFFAHGSQVKTELLIVVRDIALEVHGSATGARRELIDMDAVAGKSQRSIHLAQPARQSRIGRARVLDGDCALRKRISPGTSDGDMNGHQTGRG